MIGTIYYIFNRNLSSSPPGTQNLCFLSIRIDESDPSVAHIFNELQFSNYNFSDAYQRIIFYLWQYRCNVTLTVATTETGSHFTSTGNVRHEMCTWEVWSSSYVCMYQPNHLLQRLRNIYIYTYIQKLNYKNKSRYESIAIVMTGVQISNSNKFNKLR